MPYDPTNSELNHEFAQQEEADKLDRLLEPYRIEIEDLDRKLRENRIEIDKLGADNDQLALINSQIEANAFARGFTWGVILGAFFMYLFCYIFLIPHS